jgi:hypothetical protein
VVTLNRTQPAKGIKLEEENRSFRNVVNVYSVMCGFKAVERGSVTSDVLQK